MINMDEKILNYINAQTKVQDRTSKVIDRMNEIINIQSKKIRQHDNNVKFLGIMQIATLIVLGLVHSVHSGWFDNIGWLQ